MRACVIYTCASGVCSRARRARQGLERIGVGVAELEVNAGKMFAQCGGERFEHGALAGPVAECDRAPAALREGERVVVADFAGDQNVRLQAAWEILVKAAGGANEDGKCPDAAPGRADKLW